VRIEPGQPFPSRLSESGGMERSNDQISKAKNNSKERNSEMTTQAKRLGKRRSAAIASLVLGATLAGVVALAGPAQQAEAAFTEKVVFSSNRTTGVDNPTGDLEIFKMNPDGTGVRQLTFNKAEDFAPILSPDGSRITYETEGRQISNPEGDWEVYVMNASDGKGKKNLSDNGADVYDYYPDFSPGSKRIAYQSYGVQGSNKEGDYEVYVVNAIDGTGNKNLTNNGGDVVDFLFPGFSSDGTRIFYETKGAQGSNLQGDDEVYRLNTSDGLGKKNLTDNAVFDGAYPD
jgi:Tol biopolymer transport system component